MKFKDFLHKLKEVWKDPRKKAGIKLLSYFIFFFVFMLIASIVNNVKSYENNGNLRTTTTTIQVDKYNEKQKDLLTNKYNINYVININDKEYKINGIIENNIVTGYIESDADIKKIKIKDKNIYEIINDNEISLETDIDINLISLDYIINIVKQNRGIIKDEKGIKIYTYNINDINSIIYIETDEDSINKINIENNTNKYQLNFDK